MAYTTEQIAGILKAGSRIVADTSIDHLLTDSRRLIAPASSLFFALRSRSRDGHTFIQELYDRGVRNFVVQQEFNVTSYPEANFIFTGGVLKALQQLAAYQRHQYTYPVIGITGSNGKTIVKEWLYQLLHKDYPIIRSPRSYNSQVGVPLSVWQMNAQHTLAIFEAGISEPGEMEQLQLIIDPKIGILTNIGSAHDEGFSNTAQKLAEKLALFKNSRCLIYPFDDVLIRNQTEHLKVPEKIGWGKTEGAVIWIKAIQKEGAVTIVTIVFHQLEYTFSIPFLDDASVNNALTCIATLLYLQVDTVSINQRLADLQPVELRMQLRKAINECVLINDSYSFDLVSLNIALDFLRQQPYTEKTVILSDLPVVATAQQYLEIIQLLIASDVQVLIAIGEQWLDYRNQLDTKALQVQYFSGTAQFAAQFLPAHFRHQAILVKGARIFGLEEIGKLFEVQVHQTVMEVNLTAMVQNLNAYKKLLQPGTKMMAMIKAFGYGSGSAEIATLLQYHKVDYLAVAYADEGVELRKAGISLPIMVMNADPATFDALTEYNLEPELYSLNIATAFHAYLKKEGLQQFPVHLKFDTGMHRLGFEAKDILQLKDFLQNNTTFSIRSVFSHLAGSEDASLDGFTTQQLQTFLGYVDLLKDLLPANVIRHIANSSGILRHPAAQLDMVRLGIGLYGVDSSASDTLNLQTVATLKTTIAQLREVKAGETVGYNRRGVLQRDSVIATLRIGYADGVSRRLGNGNGYVFIQGKRAPITGSVCMDMIMADVTGIDGVKEGDEAEIFGKNIKVEEVAAWCGTIAYEILTGIHHRVKRLYIEE